MQITGSGGGGGGEGKVPTSKRPLSLVPFVSCCKITLILCYLFIYFSGGGGGRVSLPVIKRSKKNPRTSNYFAEGEPRENV